jgi:quercetin dioxygenase-like cupin family protein
MGRREQAIATGRHVGGVAGPLPVPRSQPFRAAAGRFDAQADTLLQQVVGKLRPVSVRGRLIRRMAHTSSGDVPGVAAILPPGIQQVVHFLGAVVCVRAGGDATGGRLSIVEHQCERGYNSPLHRHTLAEEAFVVLDGDLRLEVGDKAHVAGSGAVAYLPRGVPHGFAVTSPQARFLTIHTPADFDQFVLAVGTPTPTSEATQIEEPPDPTLLAEMAATYGIEILGPPPRI